MSEDTEDGRDHDGHDDGQDHHHGDGHDHDPDDTGHEHNHHHHDAECVGLAVVTVSSSRSTGDDPAGDAIATATGEAGHELVTRELIGDDYDGVQSAVDNLVGRGDVDAVVTTGGTGVTPDDVTIEAVQPLLDKELPGFGELFRSLSREEVGTRVVGTRATAGIADGVPVFCLPGSENAARLGIESVILPEVGHLVGLATRE
jgi:molybdenum cofactor biosynthesis protein B